MIYTCIMLVVFAENLFLNEANSIIDINRLSIFVTLNL